MIYFIQSEKDGAIKIGQTKGDVERRLMTLQSSTPETLKILGVMKGDVWLEKDLHERFKDLHIKSEWFKSHTRLLDYINNNSHYEKPKKEVKQKKPKKVQVCMMIYPDVYKKLGEYAKATGRTRSGLAGWLLQLGMERLEKERKP